MTAHRNDTHAKLAASWADKNGKGLSSGQLVQLFGKAIQAIEQRSLVTLSIVTVTVVIDRALYESKDTFPLLSEIKIESGRMNLSGLLDNSAHHEPEELRKALLHLLIELLNVLGNITADILTTPLHKVLMEVTGEPASASTGHQALRVMNASKKNREKA
jgi:hypothetical protein